MTDLRISDIAEMTGFSMRYWQKRAAAGEVPETLTQQRYAFLKIDQLHRALKRPSNIVYLSRKGQNKGQFESNGE